MMMIPPSSLFPPLLRASISQSRLINLTISSSSLISTFLLVIYTRRARLPLSAHPLFLSYPISALSGPVLYCPVPHHAHTFFSLRFLSSFSHNGHPITAYHLQIIYSRKKNGSEDHDAQAYTCTLHTLSLFSLPLIFSLNH